MPFHKPFAKAHNQYHVFSKQNLTFPFPQIDAQYSVGQVCKACIPQTFHWYCVVVLKRENKQGVNIYYVCFYPLCMNLIYWYPWWQNWSRALQWPCLVHSFEIASIVPIKLLLVSRSLIQDFVLTSIFMWRKKLCHQIHWETSIVSLTWLTIRNFTQLNIFALILLPWMPSLTVPNPRS